MLKIRGKRKPISFKGREPAFFTEKGYSPVAIALGRIETRRGLPYGKRVFTKFRAEILERMKRKNFFLVPDQIKLRTRSRREGREWVKSHGIQKEKEVRFPVGQFNKAFRFFFNRRPIKGERVTVFASFRGKFAKVLQKAGFDVLVTDPSLYWVRKARERGLSARVAAFETLPKRKRLLLNASFEPNPIYESFSGFLGLIKSLAHTEKGLLLVSYRGAPTEGKKPVAASFTPVNPIDTIAVNVYGADVKRCYSGKFDYKLIQPTPQSRMKAVIDSKVLSYLKKRNRKTAALKEMARITGLEETTIEESLRRIQGVLLGHYEDKNHLYYNHLEQFTKPLNPFGWVKIEK